ncbi:MAG: acyl dehydratase [Dehalococcoidia bacterium]|nr:acyl dehydratase [Dehalococcoidia bacterium]
MVEQQPHIVGEQEYGTYVSGEEEREITDEMIALAKTRIGVESFRSRDGWNTEASRSAIRHYAHSLGMDNPLYSDPEYAAKTRWHGIVAPPTFSSTLGVAVKREVTPEQREQARDPLAGIHAWYAGTHTQFFRPIYIGDTLYRRNINGDYVEKRSEFTGRTVIDYGCIEASNQRGEMVQRSTGYSIRGGRQKKWGERQKYADIQPQTYTPEDIKKIEADYDRMEVRGANPRYWEDVQVGNELTPVVAGPLRLTDILAFASGSGLLMSGSDGFKLGYEQRKKIPRAWLVNRAGIPDVIEAVHWDHAISQRTGNPLAYDYGPQRTAIMTHVITNWMGDDGWLKMIDNQIRRFVYIGDTMWAKGRVTGKEQVNGESVVDLEVWVEDQRGRITAPGRAEVLLPSRERGPVAIPPTFASPPPGWYA